MMNDENTNKVPIKCVECGKPIRRIGIDAICTNEPNDKINQIYHINCFFQKFQQPPINKYNDRIEVVDVRIHHQAIKKIRICPDCRKPMPPQVHYCEKCRKRRAKYSKKDRQRRWRKKSFVSRRKVEFSL